MQSEGPTRPSTVRFLLPRVMGVAERLQCPAPVKRRHILPGNMQECRLRRCTKVAGGKHDQAAWGCN